LSLQIYDVTGEEPSDVLGPSQELTVSGYRKQVCVAQDRQLGLEAQELSFGGTIELTLLRDSVASITFGDVTGNGECRSDKGV